MKTVERYPIPVDDTPYRLVLPRDAVVLHIDVQGSPRWVMLWVEVPMFQPIGSGVVRTLQVYKSRQPIPDEHRYIGTVVAPHSEPLDSIVWHLYEHW
jgi:hypothetical protein